MNTTAALCTVKSHHWISTKCSIKSDYLIICQTHWSPGRHRWHGSSLSGFQFLSEKKVSKSSKSRKVGGGESGHRSNVILTSARSHLQRLLDALQLPLLRLLLVTLLLCRIILYCWENMKQIQINRYLIDPLVWTGCLLWGYHDNIWSNLLPGTLQFRIRGQEMMRLKISWCLFNRTDKQRLQYSATQKHTVYSSVTDVQRWPNPTTEPEKWVRHHWEQCSGGSGGFTSILEDWRQILMCLMLLQIKSDQQLSYSLLCCERFPHPHH